MAMMTSTTDYIAGFKTVQNFGVVDVLVVNSVGAVGNIMGGLKALAGGKLDAYTELNESTRKEAFDKLCDAAARVGANALIGVRFHTQFSETGVLEVLFYGTAVSVAPQ
jgi:uncharacterized protein YbjQ (UPF0145 family)